MTGFAIKRTNLTALLMVACTLASHADRCSGADRTKTSVTLRAQNVPAKALLIALKKHVPQAEMNKLMKSGGGGRGGKK